MTGSKKTLTARNSDLTIFTRTGGQSFFYFLWNRFFPNHQTLFL